MNDVYVRVRPDLAVGRTETVGRDDIVRVDRGLASVPGGLREVIVGVEVLGADGVEIDGLDAQHNATTAAAAADVVTEIAADRARVREQRDRALALARRALDTCEVRASYLIGEELAELRREVAGSADTETGTGPEHPEEGR